MVDRTDYIYQWLHKPLFGNQQELPERFIITLTLSNEFSAFTIAHPHRRLCPRALFYKFSKKRLAYWFVVSLCIISIVFICLKGSITRKRFFILLLIILFSPVGNSGAEREAEFSTKCCRILSAFPLFFNMGSVGLASRRTEFNFNFRRMIGACNASSCRLSATLTDPADSYANGSPFDLPYDLCCY